MKVKNEAYLRSPLLRQKFNNTNEKGCWCQAVPSITYIWTHRPHQWRRRHKNRKKKSKSDPFRPTAASAIACDTNENYLWDTLRPRPPSSSTNSPYETCSSRPTLFSSSSSQYFNRKWSSAVCGTCSESGLRRFGSGTQQLVRLIRSQKRLGIGNSANSQKTIESHSNRWMQSSVGIRELLSDCSSIPKARRVTFSNYVSENSVTDPRESCWWQRSYDHLSEHQDRFSLETDLSCLFSSTSIMFDDSVTSLISLSTRPNNSNPSFSKQSSVNRMATADPQTTTTSSSSSRLFVPERKTSIDCITIELRDISSTLNELSIKSGVCNDDKGKQHCESLSKRNDISTDTSDLIVPLLTSAVFSEKDDTNNIFHFLQQPKQEIDAAFILKQLSKVSAQTFGNYTAKNEIVNDIDSVRIDARTAYGEYESVVIEMGKRHHESPSNGCQPCESVIVANIAGIGKERNTKCCSVDNKCCLICGRKRADNSRYIRPVCQVKGVTPVTRLEHDPWIKVMSTKWSRRQSSEHESSKYSNVEKESESLVEEERFSITISDAENSCATSIAKLDSNVVHATYFIVSSREQSTSCPPELPELLRSSTSFGFATFRGARTRSAKTYLMRESVRTVEGTANRLLCVISESDSLMAAVPPFLPNKPPDWFARKIPTTRKSWSRR